jgi:hypothetical protein
MQKFKPNNNKNNQLSTNNAKNNLQANNKAKIKKKKNTQSKPHPAINPYLLTLLKPELNISARIPGSFGVSTVAIHREQTFNISTDAGGDYGFWYNPQFLADNTGSATNSTFISATAYFPSAVSTGVSLVNGQNLAVGEISHYRLVSACLEMKPSSNVLQNSGQMAVSIDRGVNMGPINPVAAPAGNSEIPQVAHVRQAQHHSIANINKGESVRACWYPSKLKDFDWIQVNNAASTIATDVGYVINGYIQGATVNGVLGAVSFNINIYTNYEVLPNTGTGWYGTGLPCQSTENPAVLAAKFKATPNAITQVISTNGVINNNNKLY